MIFISTTDLLGPDWRFLAPFCDDPAIGWQTCSGRPQNRLERLVRRPALARWRAALQAARAARAAEGAVLVSHLPLMGAATNVMRRRLCPDVPQVAFSFNFTDLPQGRRRAWLTGALRGIDEFVVFSRFEKGLYSSHFDIPEARIRFLPWAMEPPRPGPDNPAAGQGDYLCAIGGEGRDYALLAEGMRTLPGVRMVIVGRPHSVAGISFPDNVTVFTNLPLAQTWAIAAGSGGMVIPLKSATTACGHITLIGAQQLGLPLVITASRGVEDYVEDGTTARLVTAGDAAALTAAITELRDNPGAAAARAARAWTRAMTENALPAWVAYFAGLRDRLAPGA